MLCTDAWRAFSSYANSKGLAHYRFKSDGKKRVKGVYHIQNVNSYLHFSDTIPESIEMYDYVLQEDGTMKYSSLATESVSLELTDKVGSFKLKENLSSKLSSNSNDYEPGKLIRGFRLIGKWDEQLREYAFVIRSDAVSSE